MTRAAAAAAGRFAGEYTAVYDGVLGPWFLPTFIPETGLRALHYVILLPLIKTCVTRVLAREGHGFSDEAATRKVHDEFRRAPIAARHVLREPPDDADAVADDVMARFTTGSLEIRG